MISSPLRADARDMNAEEPPKGLPTADRAAIQRVWRTIIDTDARLV